MIVFSGDEYFCLGMRTIYSYLRLKNDENILIVDSEKDNIYIFDMSRTVSGVSLNPLASLARSQYIVFPRRSSVNQFIYFISYITANRESWPKRSPLSEKDLLIAQAIYSGIGNPRISQQYGIHIKKVSACKQLVLQKLDMENTAMLHALLTAWSRVCPLIPALRYGNFNASTGTVLDLEKRLNLLSQEKIDRKMTLFDTGIHKEWMVASQVNDSRW